MAKMFSIFFVVCVVGMTLGLPIEQNDVLNSHPEYGFNYGADGKPEKWVSPSLHEGGDYKKDEKVDAVEDAKKVKCNDPVSLVICPNGRVLDADGCPTNDCKPLYKEHPDILNSHPEYGFNYGADGKPEKWVSPSLHEGGDYRRDFVAEMVRDTEGYFKRDVLNSHPEYGFNYGVDGKPEKWVSPSIHEGGDYKKDSEEEEYDDYEEDTSEEQNDVLNSHPEYGFNYGADGKPEKWVSPSLHEGGDYKRNSPDENTDDIEEEEDDQEDAYINAGAHANLLGILGVGAKVDLHPAHPRINTGLFDQEDMVEE